MAANRARRAARTTGRHSADAPIHRTVSPDYATISSVESRPVVDAEIPLETQQWADQVLAELRMSEPAMPDPESAPGGKWGMAAAGTAIVVVCLLAVYTLLGFFVGR